MVDKIVIGKIIPIEGVRIRGDNKAMVFVVRDLNSTAEPKTPKDVAGWTARLSGHTVKHPTDDTTLLFRIIGSIEGDSALGQFKFAPTVADMDQDGKVYVDIELVDTNGEVCTPAKGYIKFQQDLSK